jgi:uncharacterized protein
LERAIFKSLSDWAEDPDRKVLLLRGARQVGKTYAVRHLAESFESFVEVNFEELPGIHSFFSDSLEPERLCRKIANYLNMPITPGKTLLFFDEVQACPAALSALRFFYEKMPNLHVVACGSLLEFALTEIPSQGVGRITSLFMFPMTFREFLHAGGNSGLAAEMLEASPSSPLNDVFHRCLNDELRHYLLIGGMPEVVKSFAKNGDLRKCQDILSDLLRTFRDDFAKYNKNSSVALLNEVFESIVHQAGNKFKFSAVNSAVQSPTVKRALDLLIQAGLAHRIHHTSARGLPLGAQLNAKRFKVVLLDIGLHQRILGLDLAPAMVSDDFTVINRGSIAEAFVGQELRGSSNPRDPREVYYWHREARSSNAEVDYVIQHSGSVLPIEVKSGGRGSMQSMRLFLEDRGLKTGVRTSLENFGSLSDMEIVPLYAIGAFLNGDGHVCRGLEPRP